jgi:hypothetical protein
MNGTLKIKLGWFYNINSLALFFYIFIPEQSVSLMCKAWVYFGNYSWKYASAVIILKDVFYTYKIIKKLLL